MLNASSRLLAAAIALLGGARIASAQPAAPIETEPAGLDVGIGIRGGVSLDVDAVYGGLHLTLDGIGGVRDLRIEPLVEVGWGGNDNAVADFEVLLVRVGANLKYFFPLNAARTTRVHASGGLSAFYAQVQDCNDGRFGDSLCDDTSVGVTVGGGIEVHQFGVDAYLGLGDVPDFILTGLVSF